MLSKIRGQHTKKILGIVAAAVIIAFVLSNATYFFRQKEKSVTAEIKGKKTIISDFRRYIDLARLDSILYANSNNASEALASEAIIEKASIYYRLLWKAEKQGLNASDEEVVAWVKRNFSPGGKFDQPTYQRYIEYISRHFGISLTVRSFEEYVRKLIIIDKLWNTLPDVTVTDKEIKDLYLIESQKAKITYLFVPYEKFRVEIGIKPNEVEEFYNNNQSIFAREPTVNIKYALISKDDDAKTNRIDELKQLETLDQLEEKSFLDIKETGFIKKNDSIKEAGWKQEITQTAFDLEVNRISPLIDLGRYFIIVAKAGQRPAFTPALGEIETEVKEALIDSRAKEEANRFVSDLLNEINEKKLKDLVAFATKRDIDYKTTDFFKYYDYIEGLGLNNRVSEIVFSLNKGAVYPQVISLDRGAYILQLIDKTPVDQADFEAKQEKYRDNIKKRKLLIEKLNFVAGLNEEIIINLPR